MLTTAGDTFLTTEEKEKASSLRLLGNGCATTGPPQVSINPATSATVRATTPLIPPTSWSRKLRPGRRSAAARIAAIEADVTAFLMRHRRCPTVGTLAEPPQPDCRVAISLSRCLTRACGQPPARLSDIGQVRRIGDGEEAYFDQVTLDHAADRRQQGGHIATFHPLPAARIEYRLQLLDHERDIATAAKHGRDHAGQRHGPGVVLHVLGIDEDLERPTAAVLDDVVDRDVDRMVTTRPFDLVGLARQIVRPVKRLGNVNDTVLV